MTIASQAKEGVQCKFSIKEKFLLPLNKRQTSVRSQDSNTSTPPRHSNPLLLGKLKAATTRAIKAGWRREPNLKRCMWSSHRPKSRSPRPPRWRGCSKTFLQMASRLLLPALITTPCFRRWSRLSSHQPQQRN